MNEYIVMADGTKIIDTYVVSIGEDKIAIYTATIHSVRDAWEIFGDTEKTKVIHSDQFGDTETWTGFTEPGAIIPGTDQMQIVLMKPADA